MRKKLSDNCIVCGNKYFAKQYCERHWLQYYRYGKIQKRTNRDKNEVVDCGDYYEMYLYNFKNKRIAKTLIDKDNIDKVKKYKWCLTNYNYVLSQKLKIQLHQFVLGKKTGYEIDHINHDTLDNRKKNLRHCTHQQNVFNKKNVLGIRKRGKKWHSRILINKKEIFLGSFINKKDAMNARKKAEKQYFGKFSSIN